MNQPRASAAPLLLVWLLVSCAPGPQLFDTDGDGVQDADDCAPDDPLRRPGIDDPWGDDIDQDCDGAIDDGFDGDGDGSTSCGGDCDDTDASVEVLDVDGDGVTTCGGDCADTVAAVNPFATDQWGDGVDQNCDAVDGFDGDGDGEAGVGSGGLDCADDDAALGSWTDGDGDGSGLCAGDCDDGDAARRPGLPELCNGIDDDCDGYATGEADGDGDGALACDDCADGDAARFPGQLEACNAVDDDCDGLVDDGFDEDLDGVTTCAGDCDDGDPSVRPGFFEACDGVDTNCDGVVINEADFDGDGYPSCGDCDDDDTTRHPLAVEVCDQLDNDCDTIVDELGDEDLDGDGLYGGGCGGDCDDDRVGPCGVVQLAMTGSHACAVLDTGDLHCWGDGGDGRLGYATEEFIGDDEPVWTPGQVDIGGPVLQVAAGHGSTCAVGIGGSVRCWGADSHGKLGYGPPMHQIGDDESPATVGSVDLAGPAAQVVVGHDHACALLEDGTVQCWGAGSDGRLGYSNVNTIGDDETLATVGLVDVGGTVVQLTAGHLHTCGLLDTGAVRCWGYNGWGQLGYGNTEHIGDDETPATAGDVDVGGTAVQVSGGYGHTCALLDTGAVRCWGSPGDGLLGYGELEHIGDDETPATAGDVPLGGLVVQVSAGPSHTCAVMASGGVRCWGAGAGGRLGYPNIEDIGDDETPASVGDVPIDEDVVEVVTGSSNTCVLLASGAVRCWGQGYQGLNGQGDEADIGGHGLAPSSVDPVPISLPLFP